MGNKASKGPPISEEHTRPQGLYVHHDLDLRKLRRLVLEGHLAPCYPGGDESSRELEECPICFLNYPSLNRSRCCGKGICTECFLQMKPRAPFGTMQCPFCKGPSYTVDFRGPKTLEEKGIEEEEEQRVIEVEIRLRQEEIIADEERRYRQAQLQMQQRDSVRNGHASANQTEENAASATEGTVSSWADQVSASAVACGTEGGSSSRRGLTTEAAAGGRGGGGAEAPGDSAAPLVPASTPLVQLSLPSAPVVAAGGATAGVVTAAGSAAAASITTAAAEPPAQATAAGTLVSPSSGNGSSASAALPFGGFSFGWKSGGDGTSSHNASWPNWASGVRAGSLTSFGMGSGNRPTIAGATPGAAALANTSPAVPNVQQGRQGFPATSLYPSGEGGIYQAHDELAMTGAPYQHMGLGGSTASRRRALARLARDFGGTQAWFDGQERGEEGEASGTIGESGGGTSGERDGAAMWSGLSRRRVESRRGREGERSEGRRGREGGEGEDPSAELVEAALRSHEPWHQRGWGGGAAQAEDPEGSDMDAEEIMLSEAIWRSLQDSGPSQQNVSNVHNTANHGSTSVMSQPAPSHRDESPIPTIAINRPFSSVLPSTDTPGSPTTLGRTTSYPDASSPLSSAHRLVTDLSSSLQSMSASTNPSVSPYVVGPTLHSPVSSHNNNAVFSPGDTWHPSTGSASPSAPSTSAPSPGASSSSATRPILAPPFQPLASPLASISPSTKAGGDSWNAIKGFPSIQERNQQSANLSPVEDTHSRAPWDAPLDTSLPSGTRDDSYEGSSVEWRLTDKPANNRGEIGEREGQALSRFRGALEGSGQSSNAGRLPIFDDGDEEEELSANSQLERRGLDERRHTRNRSEGGGDLETACKSSSEAPRTRPYIDIIGSDGQGEGRGSRGEGRSSSWVEETEELAGSYAEQLELAMALSLVDAVTREGGESNEEGEGLAREERG
eukprot:TRINITY_DN1607_c0_g1_i2.p1 TRINITY_DN1607_c0_g1~~TRINITY_DN1607_c0_g1_i2.p1  ORF type:complete len:958 (-),score=191.88 TRINITY_DN1607_c0_g1_i2:1656-4529(-)